MNAIVSRNKFSQNWLQMADRLSSLPLNMIFRIYVMVNKSLTNGQKPSELEIVKPILKIQDNAHSYLVFSILNIQVDFDFS